MTAASGAETGTGPSGGSGTSGGSVAGNGTAAGTSGRLRASSERLESPERRIERLGTLLVAFGLATEQDIERGLEEQRRTGAKLGDVLVKLGVLSKPDLEWALADEFELRCFRVDPAAVDPEIVRLLPESFLRAHNALPYLRHGEKLTLLIDDPTKRRAVAEARRVTGLEVHAGLAGRAEIAAALDAVFGARAAAVPGALDEELETHRSLAAPGEDGAALVAPLLEAAACAGAPRVVIGVRGDGFEALGFRQGVPQGESRSTILLKGDAGAGRALLARLQSLAGLPAGRPPHPVHGSFAAKVACPALAARAGGDVEFELTVVPTVRGEQAAIEVRREAQKPRSLAALGLLPGDLARLRGLLAEREGMIVLVGESGQGKTTLFAAILEELAAAGRRVVSVERTVTALHRAVIQVRRPEADGLPPDAWIDAVLRLAPDVAAFDDLPGADACARAVRAALFGTLVLYALPLEDAVAAARFLESLPVGRGVAAAALAGVVAVRLVRETCLACREPAPLPIELTAAVTLAGGPAEGGYARGRGCEACSSTGSRGRRPLFEVVALDQDSRARLVERGSRTDLATLLAAARPESIRAQAVRLAAEGAIPVDELGLVL